MKVNIKWAIGPLAFIATTATIIAAAVTIAILFPFVVFKVLKYRIRIKKKEAAWQNEKEHRPK